MQHLTWPEAFAIVGGIMAFAMMFNGLPSIHFGSKHETRNYYYGEEEEE